MTQREINRELEILQENIERLREENQRLKEEYQRLRLDDYNYFKEDLGRSLIPDNARPIWDIIKNTHLADNYFVKPLYLFKSSLISIIVIIFIIHYTHYYLNITLYCTIV